MNISGLNMQVYYSGYGQGGKESPLLKELNDQFGSRVKILQGREVRDRDVVETKSTIVLAPELLKKAETDDKLRGKIEKSIAKIMDAKDCFETINLTAKKVELGGYVVDKNGNVTCVGKDKTNTSAGEAFRISLGRLADTGGTSYRSMIYKHFDVSASTQFYLAGLKA